MSSHSPASDHNSRTYWTPTMERYFIDLMLEHIHQGNRIGHTFNKHAWADMLAVFNAKFGSQYDKDVLKVRYTNLWKQFNDIKNLLDQDGFSWDATRQMVVANDIVWDAYIKTHPEVRPYKTKLVLNFDDLCSIYEYTVADGRYSRSSHDFDAEDENHGMNFGHGSNNNSALSGSSWGEWALGMDQYFIELLLKQQEKDNKVQNTFTKQVWTDMLVSFSEKFGSGYSKRVLRQRYKKLSKCYGDLCALVQQKGFFWDEQHQMVGADDDAWDVYIKAHPRARTYKSKVLPNYHNLKLIFGHTLDKESQNDCHQDSITKHVPAVAKSGNERSRTNWTLPMDHFLIDLMLEQVGRGNRIGQSFITQAWNEMVASFNANFNSHYDREVLKNRYKHFRKQYNDVKLLLQHDGFSWDDGRVMVTAENHVWADYIKAHPDARSYRVKRLPCYRKLCVICGDDKIDGSYIHLIDNIVVSAVETPIIKEEESASAIDSIVEWTFPMEQHFIDLMLEQVHIGNTAGSTFDAKAWAQITASFKVNFGSQYEQHILEKHCIRLREQFMEVSDILNQKGFLWDETMQMIAADHVTWESYTKEHPDAIAYRGKVIENYSNLCYIFGSGLVDSLWSRELGMMFDQHFVDVKIEECTGELPVTTILETETCNLDKKRPPLVPAGSENCSKVQKKTHKTNEHNEITNINGTMSKTEGVVNNYFSIENVIVALQAIPGLDDELVLDGCDLLEDEKKAKMFLALDTSLRKKWLLRKLGRC